MSSVTPEVAATRLARRPVLRGIPPVFVTIAWIIVGTIVALAVLGVFVEIGEPYEQNLLDTNAPPSPEHRLGTDSLGRDNHDRLIKGFGSAIVGPRVVGRTGLVAGSLHFRSIAHAAMDRRARMPAMTRRARYIARGAGS